LATGRCVFVIDRAVNASFPLRRATVNPAKPMATPRATKFPNRAPNAKPLWRALSSRDIIEQEFKAHTTRKRRGRIAPGVVVILGVFWKPFWEILLFVGYVIGG
jgi:hypothetical protein